MSGRKVSLSRPVLRQAPDRLVWPGSVAVFGHDAAAFAERVHASLEARGLPAELVRVGLRHGPGWDRRGEHVDTHPDALREALEAARDAAGDAIAIGSGVPFAAGVQAQVVVWIRAGESPITLAPLERSLSREAHLVLEDVRPTTADALAERLAGARSAPRL